MEITISMSPDHQISVLVENPEEKGGGSIRSINLKEEEEGAKEFNAAIDGIESLILAHACAGIDISSPAYIEGIQSAVEAVGNNFDFDEEE